MIASNLGQIVGRLMMDREDAPRPAVVDPKKVKIGHVQRSILDALELGAEPVTMHRIQQITGLSSVDLCCSLLKLADRGLVERTGGRKTYRYAKVQR